MISLRNIDIGREIGLQKPLLGAVRPIDTLHHYMYHIASVGSEAPGNSTGPATRGNGAAISRQYFFPMVTQYGNEVQQAAHVSMNVSPKSS